MESTERFWLKVAKSDGCWTWTGGLTSTGYGQFYPVRGVHAKAHRYSYTLAHGSIPDGVVVCHRCDNPRCVRPDHLFLGTQKDNLRDAAAKGRVRNQNIGKVMCKHGHALTGENVYTYRDGHRGCRACLRKASLAYYHRIRRSHAMEA